jgi:hypothetical protein
MKRIPKIFFLVAFVGCLPPPHDDKANLLTVHERQREAHLSKNAQMLVEMFSDDFISVNRGVIDTVLVREDDIRQFQNYFSSVEFKK